MKKILIATVLVWIFSTSAQSQFSKTFIHSNWKFTKAGSNEWQPATVPGTVHTDLLNNKRIPDPYYGTNEEKLQWIGTTNWEYKTTFNLSSNLLNKKIINLVFDGLDTYADVYLNGQLILQADNMFRQWKVNVKDLLQPKNELYIIFHAAKNRTDSLAEANLPLVIPADNSRLYVRKAQYHYGWDWGPIFITCGIWQKVYIESGNVMPVEKKFVPVNKVELVQEPDATGRSFYFKIDGKPVYMKGANYIPMDMFVPRLTKADYRKMLLRAKDANMNMLRVWGGGIYENDDFYNLCDSLGIYIWQDFMFAGQMIPHDEHFFNNVREEVKYQVKRLRHHPCIVIWCGNNEVDEAWHNWGWQKQFNVHGADSAQLWQDYERLFKDSIAAWVQQYDGSRPYVSSSPEIGWGHKESITQGDSHYWGFWWGGQDVEVFEEKTGRFSSEWGMIGMPNYSSLVKISKPADWFLFSDVLKNHMKAGNGYSKLLSYMQRYVMDSNQAKKLSAENFTYASQVLQYYLLKKAIIIQRNHYPVNMGTLIWQLNDCWPVASWSITDYYNRTPKAAWYAVKETFRDDIKLQPEEQRPINAVLQQPVFTIRQMGNKTFTIQADKDAEYVYVYKNGKDFYLSDNYFNLKAGIPKTIVLREGVFAPGTVQSLKVKSLFDIKGK
ncbi:MAG: beta-mannosidase [Niabella sp.]